LPTTDGDDDGAAVWTALAGVTVVVGVPLPAGTEARRAAVLLTAERAAVLEVCELDAVLTRDCAEAAVTAGAPAVAPAMAAIAAQLTAARVLTANRRERGRFVRCEVALRC